VNAFAALRGSANAAPIIRESPSTSDSRGFEDPLATAELSNAFLAAKALQHDADLALRRRMPPRRGGCPSQTFPPAPSPAPGDGIGPEVMAEVEKIATRFTSEGIVHFKVEVLNALRHFGVAPIADSFRIDIDRNRNRDLTLSVN
jgi:hypothetical protein